MPMVWLPEDQECNQSGHKIDRLKASFDIFEDVTNECDELGEDRQVDRNEKGHHSQLLLRKAGQRDVENQAVSTVAVYERL